jgi:hypothetical protein
MDETPKQPVEESVAELIENLTILKDSQFALLAQVQVLQAALASTLVHVQDKDKIAATFEQYMKMAKEQAPALSSRMTGLEAGILALLGKHQA